MASGPENTFLKLLNENTGIAHKICRVYFADADDRQDALQEMMLQLWRSYPSFQGQSKFSTWMYKVCLNTALSFLRKNKKPVEALAERHLQIPELHSDNQEEIAMLISAISTLSPVNKAIILLYLEDLSYEEIAGVTGLTISNVSVKLVRIKKELEEKIKSYNNENSG